jgi:hypothetical protein
VANILRRACSASSSCVFQTEGEAGQSQTAVDGADGQVVRSPRAHKTVLPVSDTAKAKTVRLVGTVTRGSKRSSLGDGGQRWRKAWSGFPVGH